MWLRAWWSCVSLLLFVACGEGGAAQLLSSSEWLVSG